MQMKYKEIVKEAWQLTEEGMNRGMADWRFYAGAVICIGAILLTHLFVHRFPELLVPFIVGPGPVGHSDRAGCSQREGAAVLAGG